MAFPLVAALETPTALALAHVTHIYILYGVEAITLSLHQPWTPFTESAIYSDLPLHSIPNAEIPAIQ